MILEIIFWISVFGILFSYLFFPLILEVLANGKVQNQNVFLVNDIDLPKVSIILAVYNEERVIEQKILSTFNSIYPIDKIEFLIGSDASSDKTDEIIKSFQSQYPQIKLKRFEGRTGKAGIVNNLSSLAQNEIFILTDANVFFDEQTIYQLVKHYKNKAICQVGGNIINPDHKKEGISFQEKSYLSRENKIKYQEGIIWGAMIGAFGGCYSIRAKNFIQVPKTILMEDFYISMHSLSLGGKSINELDALCYEDVSNKISEEFRRKVRISAGNFQNLSAFKHLLVRCNGLAFCFFGHKVLRWYGPFLILSALISNLFIFEKSNIYEYTLLLQLILLLIPVIDFLIKKMHIHIVLFRFISHFYLMNLALLFGFIKYLKGVKASVWTPTQRNQ